MRKAFPPVERPDETLSGRMLDLGCGSSPYKKFYESICRQYVAFDAYTVEGACLDVLGDAHYLPFRDGSFDAVNADVVFEHLEKPWLALSEVFRVLRRKGRLRVSVPLIFFTHGAPSDYFRFTPAGFERLAQRSGFHVDRIVPDGDHWYTVTSMGRYYFIHRGWSAVSNRTINELFDRIFLPVARRVDRLGGTRRCPSCYVLIATKH